MSFVYFAELADVTDMKFVTIYIGSERLADIFQNALELDDDYVKHLLESDDWTMMILSWAILEACLNRAITKKLGPDSIGRFIERLSLGGRSGKAELAKSLGLISKQERDFIDVYSEVRNRFAHGVKSFKTTFEDFFASSDDAAKFQRALPFQEIPGRGEEASTTFESCKRTMIFINVVAVCVNLIRKV